MSTEHLSVLIAAFLAMGAMSSALNTANPALGRSTSRLSERHRTFRESVQLHPCPHRIGPHHAGRFLTHDLSLWAAHNNTSERRVDVVRRGFVLLGIMMALVGLVPVNLHFTAHNSVAYGMVAVFAALLIGIPLLFRQLSPAFNVTTVFLAGLLLANVVLHFIIRLSQCHGVRDDRRLDHLRLARAAHPLEHRRGSGSRGTARDVGFRASDGIA